MARWDAGRRRLAVWADDPRLLLVASAAALVALVAVAALLASVGVTLGAAVTCGVGGALATLLGAAWLERRRRPRSARWLEVHGVGRALVLERRRMPRRRRTGASDASLIAAMDVLHAARARLHAHDGDVGPLLASLGPIAADWRSDAPLTRRALSLAERGGDAALLDDDSRPA